MKELVGNNSRAINLATNITSMDISEINLLPLRLMPQKKGKEVVGTIDLIRLTHDVPSMK